MALGFPLLTENCKFTLALAYSSSAGTALDSASVDMAGFESVCFFGEMITANASNFCNLATSSNDSSFNDLLGTKVTPGSSGDAALITIVKPLERYIRMEVDRGGTNTAFGTIWAVQWGARKVPVTHGSTVDSEVHISVAEGTA